MEKLESMWWTCDEDFIDDAEELGLHVNEINDEYAIVDDANNGGEWIIYFEHANSTRWIRSIREA